MKNSINDTKRVELLIRAVGQCFKFKEQPLFVGEEGAIGWEG